MGSRSRRREVEERGLFLIVVVRCCRFVAVAHEPSDSIYIFGGQNYYNASCDCYPVSEKALKFVDSDWTIDNIDAPAATVGARGLGAAAAAALMAAGLMFW